MTVKRRLVTDSLVSFLQGATGRPVEPMQGEQTTLNEVFGDTLPYVLVEPLTGGPYSSGYGNVYLDVEIPYAFHCYGLDGQQAEGMADLATAKFTDETLPFFLAGYPVLARRIETTADEPAKVANDLWHVRQPVILHVQSS